ncbi:SRPBCC family protein [Verrucomicrobiota bacterium sgz303538]
MLIKILLSLAAILVVFSIIVALQPSDFRVTRSATIAAPPEVVFAQVNTLRNWEAWSPWAKVDPAMKQTYDGPPAGVGASYTWSGNNDVGEGRNTITESRPNELVGFKLDFERPFKGTNDVEFTFKPEGNQTVVTWAMTGERNFFFKAIGLFMNCDKICGDQFEKGLSQLKSVSEAEAVAKT